MKKSEVTNSQFSKDNEHFQACCELAGIKPSARQASKYRMGKGIAKAESNRGQVDHRLSVKRNATLSLEA